MKKNAIRILSLFLVVMTLVGVISLPVSAYSYPMNYTITYKTKDGKTLGTNSGQVDAEATVREALRVTSPSYDGYVLSDSNDSVVTGKMISWRFPASNYVRHGSGSYTVYYEKACKMVVHYVYGASRRTATVDKTAYGKRGSSYTIYSPTISGYTPSKSSVSGTFSSESSSATVYYYESTYTISFNANGGSGAPSSITKKHFTNATLPSDKPYRTGYTFKGWGTSSSTSYAAYQPGSTFYTNANTTLYAVWSAKTYTISYNANGGSGGPGSQTKTHGIKMLISRVEPTRSGYTFLGWSTSPSATSSSYQPGEWYYANADRTFYAVWKKNAPATYTVSYDANGGSGAPGSQTKTENVTLTLSPVSPRRTGYTFKGWATNKFMPGAQYQPGGKYTANASVTLYALWECAHTSTEKKWTTGCEWKIVCKTCGATISSGTTHGPFSYGAWEYYSTGQHKRVKECNYGDYSTAEYASHRATTRYEQYSASQHRKYSHCTDCDTTIGSVSYENHTFTSTTSNGQVVSTCSLCGYTKTTAQTYTVSYNANGGSNAPASQTKVHGVTLTLSSTIPYRFNYEFLGWSASSSATTATYTAGGSYTGNVSVTLFSVWKYKPATYTVSYDANGGTGAPGRQTKTYGVTLTLTTIQPTRRNYLFLGWSKDRNATSASYTAGGSYTDNADVTLYAVWRYDPETYTIRYDANGGTGTPASQTKTYGVPLTLSAVKPTRAGYDFLGWSTDPAIMLTNYAPGERYTDEASATLYAVWRYIPKTYEVKYDANGGGNTPASQTKTEDVTLILTSTIPTRYGYTFKGWATSSSATSADYQAGGSYTANESVTLYAVWKINTYTVSFNANGGTNAPNPQEKTHGQNLILTIAIPTRANHVFLGWATDSTSKSVVYAPGATYTAEEDVTLYAVWQERNYLFVFEAPIDMLAYISMNKPGWEKHSYVALCSTADRAACQMLKDHPNLKTVFLCLDHDSSGIEGCYRLAESIHAIGEYSIWRKSPRNKDWDEDLKERAGRDCIPSSEHPKLEYITDSCNDLSTCNVGLDPDLASFSRFPNDIVEDGLTKLKLLYRQNEPYTMAKVCLAICYYRDRMIGQEQDFSHYVRQMQAIYRPHRDTESAGLLGDNIRKQLFALEKELKKTGAVTAVEQNIQNRKLLSLGLDCLRLCGAMEREQTAEQTESLAMTM